MIANLERHEEVVWNPPAALEALRRRDKSLRQAQQIADSLRRSPNSLRSRQPIPIRGSGEDFELMPDVYVEWLYADADDAADELLINGGKDAALEYLGAITGISYAGEDPALPRANHEPSYPSLPA